eukprot:GHVQ01022614.1.p1 GENE.GHVQ01022614.1~~GHVQ01022614.1.p1  ORF type:complete len:388 (+),score=63.71 GHVQ01022614.1:356-1519(+)
MLIAILRQSPMLLHHSPCTVINCISSVSSPLVTSHWLLLPPLSTTLSRCPTTRLPAITNSTKCMINYTYDHHMKTRQRQEMILHQTNGNVHGHVKRNFGWSSCCCYSSLWKARIQHRAVVIDYSNTSRRTLCIDVSKNNKLPTKTGTSIRMWRKAASALSAASATTAASAPLATAAGSAPSAVSTAWEAPGVTAAESQKQQQQEQQRPVAAVSVIARLSALDNHKSSDILSSTTTLTAAATPSPTYYLLIQRGKDPGADKWSFPGGKIGLGERSLDAAKRELLEEANIKESDILLHPTAVSVRDAIYAGSDGSVLHHFVISQFYGWISRTCHPSANSDALSVGWFTRNDIERLIRDEKTVGDIIELIDWTSQLETYGFMEEKYNSIR